MKRYDYLFFYLQHVALSELYATAYDIYLLQFDLKLQILIKAIM